MPPDEHAEDAHEGAVGEQRKRMPIERESVTVYVNIEGFSFYLTAGLYEDGSLGEIFIKDAGKEGSTVQGLLDAWATMFSIGLQYGVEFDMLVRKFAHMRFEPHGVTNDPLVPRARSVIDYIVSWLAQRFGSEELKSDLKKIHEQLENNV